MSSTAGETDKSKLGLILAVVAGLLAMGMMFVFLQKMKSQASGGKGTVNASVPTKEVLIAKRDLPSGHQISVNKDFSTIKIPDTKDTEDFSRQCVPSSRAREIEGRRLGVAISSKYPLLFSNLVESISIDDDFKDGYLKTIKMDKVNLIGEQLIPGDRVVIVATVPKKKDKEEAAKAAASMDPNDPAAMTAALLQSMPSMNPKNMDVETVIILENAEVFLVGTMRSVDRVQMGYMPAKRKGGSEITFRLSMAEALKLTQYENTPGAKLSLWLRPRTSSETP